jgi:hypothetical protein
MATRRDTDVSDDGLMLHSLGWSMDDDDDDDGSLVLEALLALGRPNRCRPINACHALLVCVPPLRCAPHTRASKPRDGLRFNICCCSPREWLSLHRCVYTFTAWKGCPDPALDLPPPNPNISEYQAFCWLLRTIAKAGGMGHAH